MKKTLKDYRQEMERMQAGSDSLQRGVPVEAYKTGFQKKEGYPNIQQYKRWIIALLPGLMAILMAIIALAFLIISEVLKKK